MLCGLICARGADYLEVANAKRKLINDKVDKGRLPIWLLVLQTDSNKFQKQIFWIFVQEDLTQ